MINSQSILTKSLLILAFAGSMAAFTVQPAAAQSTAKNLDCKGCVKSRHIKDGKIKGKDVKEGTIMSEDMGDEAGLDYENQMDVDPSPMTLSTSWQTVREWQVTHPATGYVICIGQGHAHWQTNYGGEIQVGWGEQNASSPPAGYNRARLTAAPNSGSYIPITSVHVFPVTGEGTKTFYWKAKKSAAGGTVRWYRHNLYCFFYATRY